MTDCKCKSIQSTLATALAGQPVEPCAMHGTLGYSGQSAQEPQGEPVALNSEALEHSLIAALNATPNL